MPGLSGSHILFDPWGRLAGMVDEEEGLVSGKPVELAEHELRSLVGVEVQHDQGLKRVEHHHVGLVGSDLRVGVLSLWCETFSTNGIFRTDEAQRVVSAPPNGGGLDLVFLHWGIRSNKGDPVGMVYPRSKKGNSNS